MRDHADGFVRDSLADVAAVGHDARCDDLTDVREKPVDAIEHGAHFIARLRDRLAHLARRDRRTVVGLGREQLAERAEDARPVVEAARRPRGLCTARPGDLLRDLPRFRHRDRAHELARRGVADLERTILADFGHDRRLDDGLRDAHLR